MATAQAPWPSACVPSGALSYGTSPPNPLHLLGSSSSPCPAASGRDSLVLSAQVPADPPRGSYPKRPEKKDCEFFTLRSASASSAIASASFPELSMAAANVLSKAPDPGPEDSVGPGRSTQAAGA